MPPPRVAICIVNWNGWNDTLECIESVRQLQYPDFVTIVVDNGSTDGSPEKILEWADQNLGPAGAVADYSRASALAGGDEPMETVLNAAPSMARLVVIRNGENQGFTGGNNIGIRYGLSRGAPADYVFLLNNDALAKADCLDRLVAADLKANAGILGAVVMTGDGREVEFAKSGPPLALFFAPIIKSYVPLPSDGNATWESGYVNGAAMLIRRDVLAAVHRLGKGYLDDRLFLYWDELAFCNTARKMGFKCVVVRDATICHKGGKVRVGLPIPSIITIQVAIAFYWPCVNSFLWDGSSFSTSFTRRCALTSALNNWISGRPKSAQAILSGLLDGYRGVTGKWKQQA